MRDLNVITGDVIGGVIEVHRDVGPGLLESTYEACLAAVLTRRGHIAERQVPLPVVYHGVKLDRGYRIDLLVDRSVIVELKTVETLNNVHFAQVVTYLKLSNLQVGLLINFNVDRLTRGIRRIVMDYPDPPSAPSNNLRVLRD